MSQQPNKKSGPQGGHGGRGANQGAIKFEKDTFKTFGRLLTYFGKNNVIKLFVVLLCLLITSLASVQSGLFIGNIIDECIEPMLLEDVPNFAPLIKAIVKMGAIYLISLAAITVQKLVMVNITNGVLFKLREDLFTHMETLPLSFFDTNAYGDIMSRYTNDVDNVRQLLSDSITDVCSSAFTIVAVYVSMLKISWKLSLIVLASVVLMYMVTIFVGGASAKYFGLRQKALGSMNGFIEEALNGQKVIKVFCHENASKEDFNKGNEDLRVKSVKANAFSNIVMPLLANIGNFQYVILAIVGGKMALSGDGVLTLGMLASFLALSKSFSRPVQFISQQVNSFVMALAGARRVFNLIDETSEVDEGYVTLVKANKDEQGEVHEAETGDWYWKYPHHNGQIEYIKLEGDVRFHEVDFGYVPEKTVLHDITLFAKPGQKIAFVGSTGAGKTTITNLINRFYDVADGKIRFDGININKIKKADLRSALGVVLQDTNLFTGTIADNIRYGKPNASMEEVIAAAKLANADSFIEKLPEGYDTVINGTGSQLSQGQCQLLAIARCALMDPPVMILDEATSSIDTRTEVLIQKGMDALMKGRTTFVIAHRLSTVQNSDAIMVVEEGRIIERGNHDELIAQQGRYYQLYTGSAAKA